MKTNGLTFLSKLMVIFAVFVAVSAPVFSETGDNSISEFEQFVRDQQWDKALESAKKMVADYPDNSENLFRLAFVNIQLANYDEAIAILKGIIRQDVKYVQAYVQLSNAYRLSGKPDEAVAILEQGMNINSNNYLLIFNYGISLMAAGKVDKAIDTFIEFANLVPMRQAEAFFRVGLCYLIKEDYDEAIIYFKKTVRSDSNYFEAYYELGNIYLKRKNGKEAEYYYNLALNVNPKYIDALYKLATVYKYQKKWNEARAVYFKILDIDPNIMDTYFSLAQCYAEMKKWKRAILVLDKAAELDPENLNIDILLGSAYGKLENYEKELEYYEKVIAVQPDLPEVIFLMAQNYKNQAKYDLALEYYNKILTKYHDDPEILYYIGQVYVRKNDLKSANKIYDKLKKLNPAIAESLDKLINPTENDNS